MRKFPGLRSDAEPLAAERDRRVRAARHARMLKIRDLEDRAWTSVLNGGPASLRQYVFTAIPTETARVVEAAIRRRETGAEMPHDPLRWPNWRRWPDALKRERAFRTPLSFLSQPKRMEIDPWHPSRWAISNM